MITDRDIVLRCVAAEEDPAQTFVRDIMTRRCTTVSPDDDCREASHLMSFQQVRRLPVVEEGKVVGIISLSDLARSRRYDMEAAQALCEISENIIVR
jgi:CBS domain-containing protein